MEETEKSIEEMLEEMGIESDEIAARLGPDIQQRLINASNSPYASAVSILGGLTSLLAIGYVGYTLFPEMSEEIVKSLRSAGDSDAPLGGVLLLAAITFMPGFAAVQPLVERIERKAEKREYDRLKTEFPHHVQDLERLRELKDTYHNLRLAYAYIATNGLG